MKHSRYAIEQFAGRIHDILQIGEDRDEKDKDKTGALSHADLVLIAQKLAPDIDGDALDDIADEAEEAESPAHAVESMIMKARWIARPARRSRPTRADTDAAIADWQLQTKHSEFENTHGPPKIRKAPSQSKAEATVPTTGTSTADPLRNPGKAPAHNSRPAGGDPAHNRITTPAPAVLTAG